MAFKDVNKNLDETKQKLTGLEEELSFLDDAFKSLGERIKSSVTQKIEEAPQSVQKLAQSFQKDLNNSIEITAKNLGKVSDINAQINKGKNVEKELAKQIESVESRRRLALRKVNTLKNLGVKFTKEDIDALMEQYELELETLKTLEDKNKKTQQSKSLSGLLTDSLAKGADEIDKSGTLSMILKGNLKDALTLNRLGEVAMLAFAMAALKASEQVADIAKNTGLSYEASVGLQEEFNQIAIDSGNINITADKLNKSFTALTKETGFIADFGGDTLETFTILTTKLKMSEESASSLATLARLQGKDTEGILESTVGTANALIKQSKVSVNVKAILEDVASASNAIKLSLSLSNTELAEAATNAKLFGTNLAGVDAIADSLVSFEESLTAELEAEMLLGKEINLDRARQLALNNDLAGLGEELKNQAAITEAFSTGNRIQQEAAAKALGLNRDALADIVMNQELASLTAEEFKNTYGETTYNQLQSVSAQEKLQLSMNKFKDAIVEVGLAFAPIVDGMAKFIAMLAESKIFLSIMGGLLAGLAVRMAILAGINMVNAVAAIWGTAPLKGIPGILAAVAGTAAFIGMITKVKGISPKDDVMMPGIGAGYGDRIISGPEGTFALNNKDTILAGTNLGGNNEAKKTNQLLQALLNRPAPKVQMDSIEVGTVAGMSAFPIQ